MVLGSKNGYSLVKRLTKLETLFIASVAMWQYVWIKHSFLPMLI